MTRARVPVRLGIVVRSLVLVAHEESDRCSKSHAHLDARLKVDRIGFVTLWSLRISEDWLSGLE